MLIHLLGHRLSFSFWKAFGFFVLGLCFVGLFLFGSEVYRNVQAIRHGDTNTFPRQRMDLSLSRAIASSNVTSEDLAHLNSTNAPSLGSASAKLTIVEFLDFDCPYSATAFNVVREAMETYKDRVRLIIRNFPVEELHPHAMNAALAAACADDQSKYWSYHDKLFVNQTQHESADLVRYAQETGMNMEKFRSCYDGHVHADDIQTDVADGLRAGVQGTPTFFFNGIKVEGAQDRETFDFLIKRFLAL